MPSSAQLASIASSLDTYRTQFAALGNALSALRVVSDQMIAQLDRDRAALETHLAAAIDMIAEADASGTDTTSVESLDTDLAGAVATADSDVQDINETSAELATEIETTAGQLIARELTAACDSQAGSIEDPAVLEGQAFKNTEVATEIKAEAEIQTAAMDTTTTEASALATTGSENAAAATATSANKVVSLTDRRKAKVITSPARRRAMAVVASVLVTAGATVGLHELMQTELGQKMLELATCDGDMLSAARDCSLLSWLTI